MNSPFDALAVRYEELWSRTAEGAAQRSAVWREFDRLFSPGDHILDLGCGPGDDAVYLERKGIRVTGIDSSPEMVRIARLRGVDARRLAIEDLASHSGRYDGVLSNFGALNCVDDLHSVARELHRLTRPGSTAALCLMTRFFWKETVRFALQFRFAAASRRWNGRTIWRGMLIRYRTNRAIQQAFAPWFGQIRQIRIGSGDHALYVMRHSL